MIFRITEIDGQESASNCLLRTSKKVSNKLAGGRTNQGWTVTSCQFISELHDYIRRQSIAADDVY